MDDDEQITEFVNRVEECWIRLGLKATERRRLVQELVADLAAAQSTGATAADLVRSDVVTFAVEVAAAEGVSLASRRPRPVVDALITTAIAVGAVVSWYLVYMNRTIYDFLAAMVSDVGAAVLMHMTAAGLVLGGMAVAIWLRYRYQPHVVSIALRTAALAAIGGLVSLAPAIALATLMGYEFSSSVVTLETILVAACVAGAIGLGHRRRPLTVA